MKIYNYLWLGIAGCLAASCVNVGEDEPAALPDIQITFPVAKTLYYNDTLVINPTITYGTDTVKSDFEFQWYKSAGNSLKPLSTEPVLVQKMDSLGNWSIYLNVKSKKDGISNIGITYASVLSQTGRGWYVQKETGNGTTDMDIFTTSEEGAITPAPISDILAKQGLKLDGQPLTMAYTENFRYKIPGNSYFTSNVKAVTLLSDKQLSTISVSDNKRIGTNGTLFFNANDSLNLSMSACISSPTQAVLVNKGKARLMPYGAQAFLPDLPGDYSLSPYLTMSYQYGYVLGFDEKSHSFVYIKDYNSSPMTFPDKVYTAGSRTKLSSNKMPGTISFLENCDKDMTLDTLTYNQGAYALFHETNHPERCLLLGLDLAQIDPSQSIGGAMKYNPIMTADTLSYSKYPELEKASVFALHKNQAILYFAYGNKVGSYAIDAYENKYNPQLLAYPDNEVVTYMHHVVCQYDTKMFSYLMVATWNKDTDQYKLHRYKIQGSNIEEEGEPMQGTGKVKTLLYIAPNLTMRYIYRYY